MEQGIQQVYGTHIFHKEELQSLCLFQVLTKKLTCHVISLCG